MKKIVKMIGNKRFILELAQINGEYVIILEERKGDKVGIQQYSEVIKDFNLASFLFDEKLIELEGN